jgi:isocitrate/isopropylmalate dehydrogenase
MVLQMFGSIAGSESLVISVNDQMQVDCVMAEAPHGTAPRLQGMNVANPMAMILAAAALLSHMKEPEAKRASRAIYEGTLETVYDGIRTADIGGASKTDEFTNEVVSRVRKKLEVWSSLA